MSLIFRLLWQQAKRHPWQTGITSLLVVLLATFWIIDPLYSSWAVDTLLGAKTGADVPYAWVFAGWGALILCMSGVSALEKYWSWKIDNLLFHERRELIYNHVLHLDYAFHTSQKSGEVIKILEEGTDELVNLQREIFINFLPSLLTAIAFVAIGLTIEPRLVLVLIACLCVYIVIVLWGVQRTVKLQQVINRLWVKAMGRAYDAAQNIATVKSGGQETREVHTMMATHGEALTKQLRVNYRWSAIEALNVFQLTRILLIGIGIVLYVQDQMTLGQLYFFQGSFFRVLTPFEILSGILPEWNKRLGKIRMGEEILNTPIRVANRNNAKVLPALQGNIVFDKACFAYQPRERVFAADHDEASSVNDTSHATPESERALTQQLPEQHRSGITTEEANLHTSDVLHDVSLDIRAGEHVALVGHSGAGKSTLALLLNRFYDVTGGRITIDGEDLRDVDVQWWRSQIGLVLQENTMFHDSLFENIRYARPTATLEEVQTAAKRAAIHDFIMSVPGGYQTVVGERGIKLSGGQRQRVAIARAMLKNPRIVILDEATSALDSVTEQEVQHGIKELITGRTAVIIAHRLSTVLHADRIAVFDQGRLIDCAPHQTLLQRCEIYKKMVDLQSQGMLAE